MNILNLSEATLNILSTVTVSIILIDILYSWSVVSDSIRKINIGLVLKHLIVVGYLLQGRMAFAVLWIGIIMLSLYVKGLVRKKIAMFEELDELKARVNEDVIKEIARRFELDPKDFEIVELDDHTAEIQYKGKVFDASKYKNIDEKDSE